MSGRPGPPAIYAKSTIRFHWISAAAIIAMWPIGKIMAAGGPPSLTLYSVHDGPSDQHELISTVFLLMFVMHVAGVVYYQVKKGRTLRRMGVPIG